ncbi:DEAD/DEAH box helicase [Allokutzneria albata]|uniref:Superfamily II DNA and RNA helicase n=1 Tax=Allokutzneria albata TaxID=211114 RepID=A0A1G9X8G6_ALLAB|nr:DEAD/DEAH box helicase [Allokutzneria albata]SDM93028.1 Superfamily II DNA and RNA helicase [Allokutzneria albata]
MSIATPARHEHAPRKPRHRATTPAAVEAQDTPEVSEVAETPETPETKTFAELGLPEVLVERLAKRGIVDAFPIQAATLPDSLAGRDVLGRGQTGSGKTLAFGLPMLVALASGRTKPMQPRGLVLVPTRELAMQVRDSLGELAEGLGLRCNIVVGGTSFPKQVAALRRGVDLLIATPGRLSDHIRQGTCALGEVQITALDEADQMADMGFLPQVRELLDQVAPGGQRLLFSATLDGDVDQLVKRYLTDPVTHSTAPPSASVSTMDHHVLLMSNDDKLDVVAEVGAREGRTIMFVRTKHGVDRLTKKLRSVGVKAGGLHGGKTQGARTRTLGDFRDGITTCLVATNVAARGIHVDDVSLVVHVDPPLDPKDYLHRAGRTARAGQAGVVVTLALQAQRRSVQAMTTKAGVRPTITRVRPGWTELSEITGAQKPSGIELPDETVRPERRPARAGGGDRGPRGFGRRPARDGDRPRGFRRDDRGGEREFRREDRGGFRSDRSEDGNREFRRDNRGDDRGFRRENDRGERGFRRDDRGERTDRGVRGDDRGGFRRDDRGFRGGDDRPARSGFRSDDRPSGRAPRDEWRRPERTAGHRDDRGHQKWEDRGGDRAARQQRGTGGRKRFNSPTH